MNQIPNIEETEALSEKIHHLYCAQYEKDHGEPYWTNGDYSKLDERTKEYDRNIARFIHHQLQKAQQHEQEMYESLDANYQLMLQKAREESVKALKVADNDIPPFPSAKDSESARIGFITGVAWARTRLHSELDQDNLTN